MLNREQTGDNPLWWLPIVGETILGFFDVFDAIFTIRDVVQHGDLAALGFLAFDVLVPVLGDAVMSIRRGAKAVGATSWSEQLRVFMEATDEGTRQVNNMVEMAVDGKKYTLKIEGDRIQWLDTKTGEIVKDITVVNDAGIDTSNRFLPNEWAEMDTLEQSSIINKAYGDPTIWGATNEAQSLPFSVFLSRSQHNPNQFGDVINAQPVSYWGLAEMSRGMDHREVAQVILDNLNSG